MKNFIKNVCSFVRRAFYVAIYVFFVFLVFSFLYNLFSLIQNRLSAQGIKILFTEEWLGFWGSIIGSFITIAGVILTIKYEVKRQNRLYRDKVQPILILINQKNNEERVGKNNKETACTNILFCPFRRFFGEYVDIETSQMLLKNVGFNEALGVNISIRAEYSNEVSNKGIDYIGAQGLDVVKITIRVPKSKLKEIFSEIYEITDKDNQFIFFEAVTHLKKHNIDDIEYVGISKIKLEINYNDVYGYTTYTSYYEIQLKTICCTGGYYKTYSHIRCLNNTLEHIPQLMKRGLYRNY